MESVTTQARATVGLIKSDEELDAALEEFDRLMDLRENRTPYQQDRYNLLGMVIERYESQHYPFEEPDPIDMIEFEMDQRGLRQKDLIPYLGSKSRVSEILNRKRKLTLKMMRNLNEAYGIPLELLVRDYDLDK
jgi:HTH-type transcriptional regulator/antitoxin HigA